MIPKGWKKKTIDDLCDLLNGNGFTSSEWDTAGLPIIRIQNLNGSRDFNYFSGEPKEQSEVSILARRLTAVSRQKTGLMQQLLTGKVRVNVDSEGELS